MLIVSSDLKKSSGSKEMFSENRREEGLKNSPLIPFSIKTSTQIFYYTVIILRHIAANESCFLNFKA